MKHYKEIGVKADFQECNIIKGFPDLDPTHPQIYSSNISVFKTSPSNINS